MSDRTEMRTFVAHDDGGSRYVIVAARLLGRVAARDQPGVWAYRTADGRFVRPAEVYRHYRVEPDGPSLTTSDPAEPDD